MAFIQIMDLKTSDIDKLNELGDEWEKATAGQHTVQRRIMCRDRSNPDHCVSIVFFDSYESAMENSNLPATQEFAGKLAGMLSAPPSFVDLDVVDDVSG